MRIGISAQIDHTPIYISDLPGHRGLVRIKEGQERKSDWGWTKNIEQAIPLSPYWQRRFIKYLRDTRQEGFLATARLIK